MYSPRVIAEPTIFIHGLGWVAVVGFLVALFVAVRRWPSFGIVAVLAALPAYQVRGSIGLPTTLLELTLLTVCAAAFTVGCLKLRRRHFGAALMLWSGGALLAVFATGQIHDGLGLWRAFYLEPIIFYCFLLTLLERDPAAKRSILYGALAGLAVTTVWSLIRAAGGEGVSYDGRFVGSFQSANYLPLLVVPLTLLILAWPDRRLLLVRGAAVITGVGLTVASNSRGGLLALLAGLTVTAAIRLPRRWLASAVAVGIMVALVSLAAGLNPLKHHEVQVVNARAAIWREAVHFISKNPVFGIGPGERFQAEFTERVKGNENETLYVAPQAQSPHNLFLTTWTEWGLLSLLGLVSLLVLCGTAAWRLPRAERAVVLSLLAAILIHGLFDTSVLKNDLAIIFVLTLALSLGIGGHHAHRR